MAPAASETTPAVYLHLFIADPEGGGSGSWLTVADQLARADGLLRRVSRMEHEQDRTLLLGVAFSDADTPPEHVPEGREELVGEVPGDLWFYFVSASGRVQRLNYDEVRQASIWSVEESLAQLSAGAADDVTDDYRGWFVSGSRSADVEAEAAIGLHSLL